ncbi:NAD-dependent epimerase/dehydratase family protein [Leifsonia sp. H3M29-4]|uniref:NAD-dependent epimerase/dehydratase family protein n=1 Tax=Salinibacterium metalliresistens TaxID=3031321 RepID=UPI0023DA0E81|nr:NAD-dependent epimerase/dehydratase family protein [Salinibacterium metalliresistens]MDF1479143.1 NAD-dependent epimerase/dehydratase family protein [Salinibacterium metalliresistens]
MKLLVVGGSGFIGSRLLDVLSARGHTFTNFDRVPAPRYGQFTTIGDVRSAEQLTAAARGHDAVIHLAAEHRDDVTPLSLYEEVNIDGARAIIAAVEAAGIERVVFTSTVAVYGLDKSDADEHTTPEPFNEYGRTKLAAEREFRTWAERGAERSLTIVRPSVVFGEGNRGNVYTLAKQVSSRRFIMIGKGDNRKSMSYVGNIVEYLADALEAPAGVHLTNYADKPDLSTRELIAVLRRSMNLPERDRVRLPLAVGLAAGHVLDAIGKITGHTFPISAIRIRKFAADTTVNTDRLNAVGYRPKFSMDEALRRTIEAEFPASERK